MSNFFAGIGQKRKGEKLKMNWQTVIGSKGRLKLEINNFKGRDGVDKTNNQVKTFYAADEIPAGQPPQQYQQPQQYPQQAQYQQTPFPTSPPPQGGNWSNGQF
ncbi:hypothetical protein D3C75_1110640 [compost metagenome]